MCIIVYKPSTAKLPSKNTLRKCWINNPDGAGYMYPDIEKGKVVIKKGFMTMNDFMSSLKQDYSKMGHCTPFVLHFRISTQGGVKRGLTHPFPLSADMDDLRKLKTTTDIGIAHNGVISLTTSYWNRKDLDYSDTMLFITDYLSLIIKDKNYYKDPDKLELIERLIDSKMAIMDDTGHTELIGHFYEDGGCYYSNIYYKEPRPKYIGGKKK